MPGMGGFHQRTRAGRSRNFRVESLESRYMLSGEPVADFSLIDTNSTSATYGESVSPGDYSGQISGWYFGHAT